MPFLGSQLMSRFKKTATSQATVQAHHGSDEQMFGAE
jgi:hypothetical protein